MSDNQAFVNQYINHTTAPLGLNPDGSAQPNEQVAPPAGGNGNGEPPMNNYNSGLDSDSDPKAATDGELANFSPEGERAFNKVLFPPDSYTEDGVYWADLPLGQRINFAVGQYHREAMRELGIIGRMFKRDPMSPFAAYSHYIINGLGMFVEGYTLFSVGNLKPLFKQTWKSCWKDHVTCEENWLNAIDYLEIVGIIVGQVLVGFEGDWVGRRFGMVQDALVMTLGSVMLTAMWGINMNGWVICYAWSLFIYGIGVGGEYPMTSTRAMETTSSPFDPAASTGDRMHRGRNVGLAFLMQGWGQFFNQVVLILLLLIFHGGNLRPGASGVYSATAVQWTFRVSFGIIAALTFYLAYYRYYKIKYADQGLADAKQRLNTSGYDINSLKLAIGHYWHRLIGTCFGWFANDFFFYGAKIFSGTFIELITGKSDDLQVTWLYNLINIGVSLVGYYFAAIFMDHKLLGRKWIQANAFICTFALFCGATFAFDTLTDPKKPGHNKAFQFIYFMSSFFTQFGYNATTFLLAAEVFPASIRASCHGVGAAFGKLGALVPTIIYNYIKGDHPNRTKFLIVTWFGLAGWVNTLIFVPDTTGLDLREQERYWEFVMAGRAEDYHGVAVNPRHLSWFEIFVLRRHLAYNPELDRQQKLVEFRQIYQSTVRQPETDLSIQQKDFLHSELGGVFEKEYNVKDIGAAPTTLHSSRLGGLEKDL